MRVNRVIRVACVIRVIRVIRVKGYAAVAGRRVVMALAACLAAVGLAGCGARFGHPLAAPEQSVYDPALLGWWIPVESDADRPGIAAQIAAQTDDAGENDNGDDDGALLLTADGEGRIAFRWWRGDPVFERRPDWKPPTLICACVGQTRYFNLPVRAELNRLLFNEIAADISHEPDPGAFESYVENRAGFYLLFRYRPQDGDTLAVELLRDRVRPDASADASADVLPPAPPLIASGMFRGARDAEGNWMVTDPPDELRRLLDRPGLDAYWFPVGGANPPALRRVRPDAYAFVSRRLRAAGVGADDVGRIKSFYRAVFNLDDGHPALAAFLSYYPAYIAAREALENARAADGESAWRPCSPGDGTEAPPASVDAELVYSTRPPEAGT